MFGDAALPVTAQGPVRVPLTFSQRARLLAGCLPVVLFGVMVAVYLALLSRGMGPPPTAVLWLVLAVALLATGYQAIQRLRDLASGVALVEEDLLNRSYAARGAQARGTYHGNFERLGTLRLMPKAHFQNSPGQRYRVVYSPASKIVWALEPPDERSRW